MKRNNYLLVIGIDDYLANAIPNLSNSVFDCKNLIEVLTDEYGFSTPINPLYNTNATRRNIIESLQHLSSLITNEDNLIIYFAGHGQMNPQTRKGYWLPHDATQSVGDYIPNSQIKDLIEDIDAKHIFLIVDACFSGTFLMKSRGLIDDDFSYQKLDGLKSRYVLASGRDELVSDGAEGHGSPFSNALLKCLRNNTQRSISVVELINFVIKEAGSKSKQQPIGTHIEGMGNEGGQMILTKRLEGLKESPIMSPEKNKPKLVDQYNDLLEKINQKKSLSRLQESPEAILSARNEIPKLQSIFNEKGKILKKGTNQRIQTYDFYEEGDHAHFGLGDYLLSCQISIPDELYHRIVTTQDFIVTFELFHGYNMEQYGELLEREQRVFYYSDQIKGWGLPQIHSQVSMKDRELLFRNRDNTLFYDLLNPIDTEDFVDQWFQKLFNKSIENLMKYL